MILITGASGTVGAAVVQEVQKSGKRFKAMYRSAQDASRAPGGMDTVVADFGDRASLRAAFAGVEAVYLVCSPVRELVELENNAIAVCAEMKVRQIVLNSALGAGDYARSFPAWHRRVEDNLRSSGLEYTILRPNSFMQNILAYMAPSIRAEGRFYSSMGSARTSFLDVRDIAAVAASALIHPEQHAAQVYELNGPEAVTYSELAERITRAAGRAVQYVDIPEAEQRKSMLGLGMPEWQVDALLDLQRYYTAGRGGEITQLLPRLLGHPPYRLDSFLEEHKDAFAAQG